MSILIVEDDLEIQSLIAYFFTKEGYDIETATDGLDGLKKLRKSHHELVVLDLMLPNLDGKNFAKIVKDMPEEYGDPKIIMVTAKTEIEDVLEGLTIGADDYIKKPFDPRELVLRAKKLLSEKKVPTLKHKIGDLLIDEGKHQVTDGENELELSKKEYDLLLYFAKHRGLILSREQILEEVWGWDYFGDSRTVDVHIRWLRKNIEKDPAHPKRIITIRSAGYRFEG